jgi:hypothetical protein
LLTIAGNMCSSLALELWIAVCQQLHEANLLLAHLTVTYQYKQLICLFLSGQPPDWGRKKILTYRLKRLDPLAGFDPSTIGRF